MKKIIGYLRRYLREHCNYRYLALLMVFVAAWVAVNFGYVSEDQFIKEDPRQGIRLLKYIAGYFLIFGGAYALQAVAEPQDRRLRSPKLWGLILFAVFLFSVRAWFNFHGYWVMDHLPYPDQTVAYKIITNGLGFVFLGIPCAIYWLIADRKREALYGFTAKGVVLWPYFVLTAMMIPLLLWAGTQPDFREVYPRAAHLNLTSDMPHYAIGTIVYEIFYSIDYVVTEFFFRGFLVIAFARFVGYKSILPMCAFYVAIHFDKPLGECISSFFGGWLLGVLSYETRSIYGGVIVHLGIALLMEVVGWINA